ncbi:mediator of DNA damage checkpoint protein 1 [Entelurus aequoreus]|uniref:mediator of DNA damage checkpoint protein 1 n=1 Tax=Entelurus aequoreus TaxID=161455 RepID=UPI002B1E5075|nr:mediator of DNA damage checkpoint protein 1 [Entelurus aequoreus]XP_061919848.1 mediator of DNA damage checkpoint protein 1 [Entelurus aequoreus]
MDATQVINYSILESDEEEKNEEEKPKPLAKLCILKNDHIPERDFPLFIGDNVLGRDADTCALPLPAPSVSKQHATICISVHRRRGSSSRADTEALVWDLGSMNGTRKGRLKLTPNVRYALSEGDRLLVADIPCRYVGWEARETPESMFPNASIEKRLKVDASGSTQASAVVALFGEAQNSPAQNSCLSLEKTPVQLQGMLVAESDLDSDGESQGHRDGRRKSLYSNSDSSKPSATCSTFMSPTNKIVPESEDESPITPSSSTRKKPCRYVSFSEEEPDINAGRQQFENKTSPATVDDSDEGEGAVVNGQTPGGTRLEEKKHGALDQHRFIREESLPRVSKSSAIPDLNIDSDTDVEDADDARPLQGTDWDVSHDAPKVDLAPPVLPDDFQLDSDTDVDEGADTSRDKTLSRLDLKMSDLSESDDDQGSAFNTHPDVRGSSNNHGPIAAISTDITIAAAESDVDTDVDESSVPPAGGGQDSDTDMEDQIPSLPAIKTPELHAALLENCSTPVQENEVEEMETQPFLTPSQGPFKRAVRSTALSSYSDGLEHEDVIVAETPPFSLQTRVQVHCDNSDTSPPSEPVSSSEETEELHREGPSFQLGLSDSSHLQSHAHSLAMENTEAFVPVSVEDTQEYVTPYHHRNDLNMEATQAYAEPARSPVRQVELALQETQAYISEPYNESKDDSNEETQPLDGTSFSANLALAETLPALMAEPSPNNLILLQTQGQISIEADLSEEHEEEAGETCNETGAIPEHQPLCTIEFKNTVPVLLKNKAMPQQLEKDTQPLIRGDFSVAKTQSMGIGQTQSTSTSLTKESDGEDPIPGLVQLQNETQSITTVAVDNQPMATSDDDEGDSEDSIPLLHNKRKARPLEETQPLTSCDFPVAEPQPIATCDTEESDDEELIQSLHKGKVRLQKETQPIATSSDLAVEVQPMTEAAIQLMATIDHNKSNEDESIAVLCNNRKEKPLQLEKETQLLIDGDFPGTETQPIAPSHSDESDNENLVPVLIHLQKETKPIMTSNDLAGEVYSMTVSATTPMAFSENEESDDEDSIPVLHIKRKARPLHLEDETQPLIACDFSVAGTQPIGTCHTDENDNENLDPVLIHLQKETKPIITSNDLAGEVYSMTVSATTPMAFSENEESDDEDSIPVLHIKRKARPLDIEDETQPLMACDFPVAGTQPIGTSHTDESDNENIIPILVHLQKDAKPITTLSDLAGEVHSMTVSATQPMAFSENEESDDEDSIPVLHIKIKASPLHIEEEAQPLIACDFSVAGTQPIGTSPTDESDNENHIPVLVHLQKDANPTTTSNKSAVEVQPMTVAATQPIALSENEESDDEDLISLSHNEIKNRLLHIKENTQPLISCDFPIAETQPMATCQTDESDDEDPIPALDQRKVQLQKETQPNTTCKSLSVEVEHMTISANQSMATSDSDESDDESMAVSLNKIKEKMLQLEEETKPLIGCDFPLAQTQPTAASHTDESDNENIIPILVHLQKDTKPITTLNNLAVEMQPMTEAATQPMTLSENGESDDESSIPVSPTKTKARPLKLEEETQPLIDCDFPVAKTQFIATCHTEESDGEDPILAINTRKVQLQKDTQTSTTSKSLAVEAQHMTISATQTMATSDSDESGGESMAVSLNKRKAKPLQLEEETKHLIGCHFPLVKSQPIDASHTDESDNENLIPVLVGLQKEMKPITTSNDLAVEVQPMTVAATQPMDLSDNEGSVDEDLIPVSLSKILNRPLHLEEETQPFIGCDFPVAETQPIATCHTEESVDEDPIPALNKGKVQLQKETQPSTTSKSLAEEVQHMTISTIQPMPTSDSEESNDKSMAVSLKKRKAKPLQLEEETQPLIGCNFPVVETSAVSHTDESDSENLIPVLVHLQKEIKPITTSNDSAVEVQPMTGAATQPMALSEHEESDDEHSIPVSHDKTKARPLHLEEEIQPLIGCDFTVAETQPIATCHTDESGDEDPIPALDQRKVELQKETQPNTTCKSLSVEAQHMTVSVNQPMATSDSDESDDESMAVLLNKIKEKTLQLEEETQTLIGCNFPVVETSAVSHTDESDSENLIPVLVHLQKEMKPITTSNDLAVEVQPMTVAATQSMALSDNDESVDEDLIPVSHDKTKARPLHLEEEIQPLIGCDFPVAETQPIATCHTDESDDDPIPALDQRKVQLQKETQPNTTFKSLSVEVQHTTISATQPMATSDSDESNDESMAVSLNKRKEKQLNVEENTKPLIGCNFPVVETQRIASHPDESDNKNLIPVFVHLQKETNPITTSNDSAVEVQPITVAATQLMALSENEEGDHKDSIPVSHNKRKARPLHLEEETQPLIGSDFLVAETQPIATCHTEESDDKDPISALNKRKVQLQKETQPNTTSKSLAVEEQHMIIFAIQPMTSSDPDETDDEDLIKYSQNKNKTMSQQLEEETQPLIGCDFSVAKTKPIAVSHTEESDSEIVIPVSVHLQKETKPISTSNDSAVEVQSMTVAVEQPMVLSKDEESDDEDSIIVPHRKRKARPLKLEETQSLISCDFLVAETQPTATTKGIDDNDPIPTLSKIKVQLLKETQPLSLNVATTQIMTTSENEVSHVDCIRKEHLLQETQSLNSTVELSGILNPKGQPEDGDKDLRSSEDKPSTAPRKPQEEEPQTLEMSALGDVLCPGQEKEESEVSSAITQPMDTCEDEEADSEIFIPGQRRNKVKPLQFEDETQSLMGSQSQSTENKPGPSLQKETLSEVGTSSSIVGRSRRTQECEEEEETQKRQTRSKKARQKSVKSSHGKASEKEATMQHTKDQQQNNNENQSIRVERLESKSNKEERHETEKKEKEAKERRQKEITDREKEEERLQATKEQERSKRERTDLEMKATERQTQNEEEKPKVPLRGRRATRRTIAAAAELELEDCPAMRTRSRSNSSNSINSEVSTLSTQESQGRGRRVKRFNGPAKATTSRRQTVAAVASGIREPPEQDIVGVSRSSSSNSLASEMSCSSLGSRSRGRRGRKRRRGGKTESGPSWVQPVFSPNPSPRPTTRSRSGWKAAVTPSENYCEMPEVKPASATLRRRRVGVNEPTTAEQSNQEDQSAGEGSPLPKRTFRRQKVKSEAVEASVDSLGNDQKEAKEDKGKGRKRELEAGEAKDDSLAPVRAKRRGTVAKPNPLDTASEDGSVPSVSSAVEVAEPQTPIGSKSRKRKAFVGASPGIYGASSPSTSCRPQSVEQFYKVLFTGVVDAAGEKVLARLGGALAKGTADMNCLVTDKVRRTVKFLCAVAKGVPIVTTHWLEKSGKAGSLLPPDAFIVKDPEQEKKFSFCLKESLTLSSSQPLLQGYEIHITKSVKPEPIHMKDIIACSGATFLSKMPSSHKPQTIVISCEEDWPLCRAAVSASLPVVSAEFILSGILQHKLDFDTHKLSGPSDNLQPAPSRRRRGSKKS